MKWTPVFREIHLLEFYLKGLPLDLVLWHNLKAKPLFSQHASMLDQTDCQIINLSQGFLWHHITFFYMKLALLMDIQVAAYTVLYLNH